ncbi:unnamed protein product [Microthlaspi erraticum]|uniref:Thioredoxin domain-containing protein n=1 Tax=Microthlaspi erraticum TaxID=1685480 RepID=A0A6D2IDN7_9BRAS|nr:unnamed protein product [Microthlaspi erraticum]
MFEVASANLLISIAIIDRVKMRLMYWFAESSVNRKRRFRTSEVDKFGTMKLGARLIAPVIILLLSLTTELTKAEVITLTPETFSDKVKEKDTAWFVKFCVPWCKHCKKLGNLWEELGNAMEGDDEIEIGEVDCGTSRAVCTKVEIHSYPTFKLFYNGEEVSKYQGKRDVESLKAFVVEETEKAAEKAQLEDKEL